jgi:CubicO group peptidase (beta-lactamase class C family)
MLYESLSQIIVVAEPFRSPHLDRSSVGSKDQSNMISKIAFCIPIFLCLFTINAFGQNFRAFQKHLSAEPAKHPDDESERRIRASLRDYFRKASGLGFSGAVLLAKDGKVLFRNGYGWADVKRRIPITADSIFDIGSGVKAFTATAIMQLEERGKLKTTDPISKYIKGVPPDKADITIYHLLTHTSGLNFDYFYDQASPEDRRIMGNRESYIKGVLGYPLAFKPGEGWAYSNTGFSLLAAIIENVSGELYGQYVSEHLFKPAGMKATGYYIPHDLRLVTHGYNDGDTEYGYPWESQWENKKPLWDLMGNGGMLTTLDDVYKWMVAIQTNKLVSQETTNKMFQPHASKSNQAHGWNVGSTDGKSYVYREGDAVPQGWNVEFRLYPNDDVIAVVLTNKRVRAGSIRRYAMPQVINTALFGKSLDLPDFANLSSPSLKRLEGVYELESGARIHVKAVDAATGGAITEPVLEIGAEGQPAIDLLYSGAELPDAEKLSLELNAKAAAYIDALRKNDLAALKIILSSDSSPEDAITRWNDFVKQNGTLEKSEVLGTSSLNQQQGVQTFVRLKFKKTVGVYKLTWRQQTLSQQAEDRLQPEITSFLRKSFVDLPLTIRFLPGSPMNFATYDLVKNRSVHIRFNDGKVVIHTKAGDVTADKRSTK